jgi:hypothetical protein|eukprot:COSAG06_NODE_2533_length_6711_cov_6.195705_3_plen_123_part_00
MSAGAARSARPPPRQLARAQRGAKGQQGERYDESLEAHSSHAARASAGPTVESAAALAHTGQVVRVKTKGQTFFLECDAGDTPTQLITRLSKLGHVSPQPYDLHFGAPPARALPRARRRSAV